jgi:uncharacterized membrane protein
MKVKFSKLSHGTKKKEKKEKKNLFMEVDATTRIGIANHKLRHRDTNYDMMTRANNLSLTQSHTRIHRI